MQVFLKFWLFASLCFAQSIGSDNQLGDGDESSEEYTAFASGESHESSESHEISATSHESSESHEASSSHEHPQSHESTESHESNESEDHDSDESQEVAVPSTPTEPVQPTQPVTPPRPGGGPASCQPNSGFMWCAAKGKCLQPWVEDCTQFGPATRTDVRITASSSVTTPDQNQAAAQVAAGLYSQQASRPYTAPSNVYTQTPYTFPSAPAQPVYRQPAQPYTQPAPQPVFTQPVLITNLGAQPQLYTQIQAQPQLYTQIQPAQVFSAPAQVQVFSAPAAFSSNPYTFPTAPATNFGNPGTLVINGGFTGAASFPGPYSMPPAGLFPPAFVSS